MSTDNPDLPGIDMEPLRHCEIMQSVIAVVLNREETTPEEINAYLAEEGAETLYEAHLAPAITTVERAIRGELEPVGPEDPPAKAHLQSVSAASANRAPFQRHATPTTKGGIHMSKHPKTQIIDGHVFDSDGNPIGANLVVKHIDVDGESCLSLSGTDWFADRPGGLFNTADDVQFCVPQSALAEPGVWTVIGVYEDHREEYADYPDPQFQRWAEVVKADSSAEAIAAVRKQLGDTADVVVPGCVAGDVRVVD